MQIASIELYDLLKGKIGETEAKALVSFVEKEIEDKFADKKDALVAEIETKIAQSEARLTLRMFYFWMGQVAVIAGMLAYFFNRH